MSEYSNLTHVIVIGCGVIGAAIAYELSQVAGLSVTVLDQQPPAQAATGAALGVLMGAISQKFRGKGLELRLASIQRYESLIPELEALTGHSIPYNRQGILKLCFTEEERVNWQSLAQMRYSQGWPLELLDLPQLHDRYPQIRHPQIIGAVYSPCDRQVDPVALTLALVEAAQINGVMFQVGTTVQGFATDSRVAVDPADLKICSQVLTDRGAIAADWVVISAGVGSTGLTNALKQPVEIRPVLGQAVHLQLEPSLVDTAEQPQPVITGKDVHIVPRNPGEYWVGATVEFPVNEQIPSPDPKCLTAVIEQAFSFYPALASAQILRTWLGLRPRPEGRPAPIIERLAGYQNLILATGHYRNGILLAPATAQAIRVMIS